MLRPIPMDKRGDGQAPWTVSHAEQDPGREPPAWREQDWGGCTFHRATHPTPRGDSTPAMGPRQGEQNRGGLAAKLKMELSFVLREGKATHSTTPALGPQPACCDDGPHAWHEAWAPQPPHHPGEQQATDRGSEQPVGWGRSDSAPMAAAPHLLGPTA